MIKEDAVSVTDEALLERIQRTHDHAAFTELVNRHALRYRRMAFRFTNVANEAEDIVQDAFLALWQKPDLWDAARGVKFTTWFYRIVMNRCLDRLRRNKFSAPLQDDYLAPDMAVDEALIIRQRAQKVERVFRNLPQAMQTALNLSFYEPVPNREAAEIMGLSLKAFQSLLIRAKNALRDKVMKSETVLEKRYGTR